jgi:hypothetical protein
MEERPSAISCEYIEQAAVEKRQGMVLQFEGLGVGLTSLHHEK